MAAARPAPVALVTGAAKGIGLAIAEGLAAKGMTVWLTARDAGDAEREAERLTGRGLDVRSAALDVTDEASIAAAARAVEAAHGRLDVLVNNAAVLLDEGTRATALAADVLRRTFETNAVAPLLVAQAFLPLLAMSGRARIVNVSSTAGSLADAAASVSAFDGFVAPAYGASKAALNMLTVSLAKDLKTRGILVNAMCPGWVRTAMGGPSAPLTPEQGADTAIWLATIPDDGPTGGFFSERAPTPW